MLFWRMLSADSDRDPGFIAVRSFRFVIVILIIWTLATLAVRRYVCIGWLWPVRVASNSMAPALLGPHAQQACPDCTELVIVDASQGVPRSATCFNCGATLESFDAATLRPGSRVVLDRWTVRRPGPQRFDTVAFTAKGADRRWLTKRVLGLPGETVEISHGDILIDGACVRKSAAQFLNSAILVHAFRGSRHRPSQANSSRLIPRSDHSRWEVDRGTWIRAPSLDSVFGSSGTDVDWLDYHHQASAEVVGSGEARCQILDEYGYNQFESRQLHVVCDIACAATVSFQGSGPMFMEVSTPCGRARLSVWNGQMPIVSLNGQVLSASDRGTRLSADSVNLPGRAQILFGYWDEQLTYRLQDGLELQFVVPVENCSTANAVTADAPHAPQFSIGVQGNQEIALTEFQVWRDVYYFADAECGAATRFQLGSDQYALLGDNTSKSDDARTSPERGIIRRDQILGIVTRVN